MGEKLEEKKNGPGRGQGVDNESFWKAMMKIGHLECVNNSDQQ